MTPGAIVRAPQAAARERYDLIVIGGGIYGVALAFEAARRGLSPVLLERGDFGGETSWHSLRILHGGLRYLQKLDVRRFRESVGERSWFLRHFPDLARPQPFLMPLYGEGLNRPAVFRAAFMLDRILGADRNRGLSGDRCIPAGRVLGRDATVGTFPAVDAKGLKGGALWHDGSMPVSQRLLIELLRWAASCGATALNYVEAIDLINDDARVSGVQAVDRITGETLEFRAPVVVNATGPWTRGIARSFDRDVPALLHPVLVFNLVFDRPPLADVGLALTPRRKGARTYFFHPCQERLFIGTYHAAWDGSIEAPRPDRPLLDGFLGDVNEVVPDLRLTSDDVLRTHAGLIPGAGPGAHEFADRELIHDHGAAGGPTGLYSVSGIKFTTARAVAERTLRLIWGGRLAGPQPAERPAANDVPDEPAFGRLRGSDPAAAMELIRRLVDEEAVLRPDDLTLRRTDWGADPRNVHELEALVRARLEERSREAVQRVPA